MDIYFRLPISYEDKQLFVKGIKLHGKGKSLEDAYSDLISSNPQYYDTLSHGEFEEVEGYKYLLIPFCLDMYNHILELEPLGGDNSFDKKKILPNHLKNATAEEVIKYGY